MYLGSWQIDDVVTFTANTHSASTGAETDADSAPTYRVYEDETGTAILNGTMALLDDANTVGHYSEQITLSAANGFENDKSYHIRIRGVVGGVAGATIRTLQVEAALATASALASLVTTVGTAGDGLTNINLPNQTMDIVGNITGNLSGSVGSVTAAVAITSNVKKNQALASFEFLMTDSTNHAPATGLTVTCTRSIDGAAFGAGTLANVAEVANGIYKVDFGAGDLNGNVIVLKATATGADATFERIITQP